MILLRTLSSDSSRQKNVLRHDSHTLGVDGAQIRVLKETHQISLGAFLEREERSTLKTKIRPDLLRNLANQSLEG
jgi:histone H3